MASINSLRDDIDALPGELQRMIYEHALLSPYPLRPALESKRAQEPRAPLENLFDVSLLLDNQRLFPRAQQFFYAENVFTYTILPLGLADLRLNEANQYRVDYLANMPLMTRVSMNYTCRGDDAIRENSGIVIASPFLERMKYRHNFPIANYLEYVVRHCPLLRTLTLLIKPECHDANGYSGTVDSLFDLQYGSGPNNSTVGSRVPYNTAQMLAQLLKLPKLERLTIIAPIEIREANDHRFSVAPHIQWLTEAEGRGDEYSDIPKSVLAAARAALVPLRRSKKGDLREEQLRHWTYRPVEERLKQEEKDRDAKVRLDARWT